MYIFNYLIYSILCLLFVFVSCGNCMCGFESNSQLFSRLAFLCARMVLMNKFTKLKAIHNLKVITIFV